MKNNSLQKKKEFYSNIMTKTLQKTLFNREWGEVEYSWKMEQDYERKKLGVCLRQTVTLFIMTRLTAWLRNIITQDIPV